MSLRILLVVVYTCETLSPAHNDAYGPFPRKGFDIHVLGGK